MERPWLFTMQHHLHHPTPIRHLTVPLLTVKSFLILLHCRVIIIKASFHKSGSLQNYPHYNNDSPYLYLWHVQSVQMDQEKILCPLDCQEVKTMCLFSRQKHQRGNKDASIWSIPIWWHFSDERWNRERLGSSVRAEEQKKRDPNRTCWELSDRSALLEYLPIGSGFPSVVSAAFLGQTIVIVKKRTNKKKKKPQLKVAAVLLRTFLQWRDECD